MRNLIKALEDETREYSKPDKSWSWPPIWSKLLLVSVIFVISGIILIESSTSDFWVYVGAGLFMPLFILVILVFYMAEKVEPMFIPVLKKLFRKMKLH